MRPDAPGSAMHVLACLLLALAAGPAHASILDNAWRRLWPSKQETVHVIFSNHLVCPPPPPPVQGRLLTISTPLGGLQTALCHRRFRLSGL